MKEKSYFPNQDTSYDGDLDRLNLRAVTEG